MRSKLFVPGARPELFRKALSSQADVISIDLEDSVPESLKAEARGKVGEFLQSAEVRSATKLIIVRVNALASPHFEADVLAVARPGLAMLNLPKPESADDIRAAVAVIERAEGLNQVAQPVGILANIETPRALRRAAEIGAAHPRVVGLQLGYADLFEPLGIDRRDVAAVHATMFAMRMAAAEAGVFAYDGAFGNVQDPDGYRAEAEMSHRLGYLGKSCIHPSQIVLANQVFQPGAEDIAFSLRVLAQALKADGRQAGAFLVDGRMIDAPFIRRAEMIVAIARNLGIVTGE